MIYDRPYMRTPGGPSLSPHRATYSLLIATLGIFVLQHIIQVFFPNAQGAGMPRDLLYDGFALSASHLKEYKFWTLLSYCFLHSMNSLWHVAGNMLGLYFIGRILEPQIGMKAFLVLYLGGALAGGLLYVALHLRSESLVIGASAAVFALLTLFCLRHPQQKVTLLLFFVLPINIRPKYLLRIALAGTLFGLLFYELGNMGRGIAHSSHLGGIIFGFFFHHYADRVKFLALGPGKTTGFELPKWFVRRKKKAPFNYTVNRPAANKTSPEVDRILDKISAKGFDALSKKEKEVLQRVREDLK
ncbi:MAG: Uncharacterised protein [Opitutia bacterium UBA7350]|nr:MAG: Uncharacterised protein [Opitutae bacterium UBA7350]